MSAPGYFTLTAARAGGSVPNPAVSGSTLDRWYANFAGPDGQNYEDVYWLRKPGSDPNVGDSFYGEMSSSDKGFRFRSKQAPPGESAPANVARSGGGAPPQQAGAGPRGDRSAAIERQHSQEMALRFVTMTGDAQDLALDQPEVVAAYLNGPLRKLIDWFQQDIRRSPAPPAAPEVAEGDDPEIPF